MFVLAVRYLNGWSMAAADGAKKELAEWPPHPDRVFMALAAAHFEGDRSDKARRVLEWLETLSAPALAASEASNREIVTHYVPVNDPAAPSIRVDNLSRVSAEQVSEGVSLLPEKRSRQPRQFPVSIPDDDTVYLVWDDISIAPDHSAALSELCEQVTSVGHSASLVQMWVANDVSAAANWLPDGGPAAHPMRIPAPGRLAALEAAYNEGQRLAWLETESAIAQAKGKNRKALQEARAAQLGDQPPSYRRPPIAPAAHYTRKAGTVPGLEVTHGMFSDRILIFKQVRGARLGLESTLLITDVFREYVLQQCPEQPPPAWVSGHASDGTPIRDPHIAFFPLPHVGHEHAKGHLMGLGVAVPKNIPAGEIGRCLERLFELNEQGEVVLFTLYRGALFECSFEFDVASDTPPAALRSTTWTGSPEGASTWATVTPIVLDRHGKGREIWSEAVETIRVSCERAGLPRPVHTILGPVSHFMGALGTRSTPHLLRKDGGKRHHVHAVLTFPAPVRGPVLIGAGRFRGYGLCRPWPPMPGRDR
jgi:CRISPR-associated protein Csb2